MRPNNPVPLNPEKKRLVKAVVPLPNGFFGSPYAFTLSAYHFLTSSRGLSMASHPDHTAQISRINRIIGQLEGVKKQIASNTYCPNILIQTKAIVSAIKSLETSLLEKHIQHCVKNAIQSGKQEEEKIAELLHIFKTRIK
ncbi:MAG: metal-sensitive transcriptional regulator [Bdellovibrionota bacterium]